MDRKRLSTFRRRLEQKRVELSQLVVKTETASRGLTDRKSGDEGEQAARSYSRDLLNSQSDSGRMQLRLIGDALARMDSGEFGICEECGQSISFKRLQAVPWTPNCRDCQEELENQEPDA